MIRKIVCIEHRTVNKPSCCDGEKHQMNHRWRPPKKSNDKAWKKIEKGHWLWENDIPLDTDAGILYPTVLPKDFRSLGLWRNRLSNPKFLKRGWDEQ